MTSSASTRPSTPGPTMIPAMISTTEAGTGRRGNSASTSGIATAMTMTSMSSLYESAASTAGRPAGYGRVTGDALEPRPASPRTRPPIGGSPRDDPAGSVDRGHGTWPPSVEPLP
jgi:hypothetical protein